MISRRGSSSTVVALLALLASGCRGDGLGPDAASGSDRPEPVARAVVAAPGRVEGASDVVEVNAGIEGVIAEVLVREGDRVRAGDVLVRLACRDLRARVEAARAAADSARQARRRLVRGQREEERRAAAAATESARAVLEQAQQHYERMQRLSEGVGVVSRNQVDLARRDLDVAAAGLRAADERERLANADPLPEELKAAFAEIHAAEAQAREAAARLERCTVTAPTSGSVLRRHMEPGEYVSLVDPRPIVSIADISRYRVRTEVDERDVGRVAPGQPVAVTADGFGDLRLTGQVARLGLLMGRKRVRTGDPAEKSDRDVQEVMVDLDGQDPRLVVGLRVTVLFGDPRHPEALGRPAPAVAVSRRD